MANGPAPEVIYLSPEVTANFDGNGSENEKLEIGAYLTKGGQLKFFFRADYEDKQNPDPNKIIRPDIAVRNLNNPGLEDELLDVWQADFRRVLPSKRLGQDKLNRINQILEDRVHKMTIPVTLATLFPVKGDPHSKCGGGYAGGWCVGTS